MLTLSMQTAVSKVMDIKTPSSGEADKNLWLNLHYLITQHDQIKFVIMNPEDYDWSKQKRAELQLNKLVNTAWFSPMFNLHQNNQTDAISINSTEIDVPNLAHELAKWLLADALSVRLQLQLHKIIWAAAKGK